MRTIKKKVALLPKFFWIQAIRRQWWIGRPKIHTAKMPEDRANVRARLPPSSLIALFPLSIYRISYITLMRYLRLLSLKYVRMIRAYYSHTLMRMNRFPRTFFFFFFGPLFFSLYFFFSEGNLCGRMAGKSG